MNAEMEGIDIQFTNVSLMVDVWDPLVTKSLRPGKYAPYLELYNTTLCLLRLGYFSKENRFKQR